MNAPVLYEKKDTTAVITLNRPEKRNAINQALLAGFYDALENGGADQDVRAIVVTGAGDSFCAGLDLKVLGTENLMDPRGDGKDLLDILPTINKPLIGAVNGHAITGGFELALNCDFLIASENASFMDTHAKIGIHPGWGMSQLLALAVGVRRARQMSLTCRFIDAQTALVWGLVNEVLPRENLMNRALELAEFVAQTNPVMLPTMRTLINEGAKKNHADAMALEKEGFLGFLRQSGILK